MDAGLDRHWTPPSSDLRVGLVNNAPVDAFATTERQFASLLQAAWGSHVRLHVFSLPGVLQERVRHHPAVAHCAPIEAIADFNLDALIVTGAEPSTELLSDEPFWKSLTGLLDWAERRALPVALSCLAAHAAVLHQAGISRTRLPEKRFGVFAHEGDCTQPLMRDLARIYMAPHSRWNDVKAEPLERAGYQILSFSRAAGVELFTHRARPDWLYLQGHPEYRPRTLVSQFRRDVARFERGAAACFPAIPAGVFSTDTEQALRRLRQDCSAPHGSVLPELVEILPDDLWRDNAVRLFRNWLHYAAADLKMR